MLPAAAALHLMGPNQRITRTTKQAASRHIHIGRAYVKNNAAHSGRALLYGSKPLLHKCRSAGSFDAHANLVNMCKKSRCPLLPGFA